MITAPRPTVIWWGIHPPVDIGRELDARGLKLIASESDDSLIHAETRAVLIPHDTSKGPAALGGRLKHVIAQVVDRGGSAIAVIFNEADREGAIKQTAELPTRVVDGTMAAFVAETCARLEPGPAEAQVTVEIGTDTVVSDRETLLLRRAFNGFAKVDVKELTGGLTGARVWRVTAMANDGRTAQPYLVKAGDLRTITEEIDTMRAFVLDHMPFPNRPPLLVERCVSGLDRRLLVSMLVEKADRLDHYLSAGRSLEKIVHSIFEGPLRCWRDNRVELDIRLGLAYESYVRGTLDLKTGKYPKDIDLAEAHRLAKTVDPLAPDPLAIVTRMKRYGARTVHACQAHGDLHPRNIFVRHNSDEIILIDFAKSGNLSNPMVWDAATLDVSLAFDGWADPTTAVDIAEILTLYGPNPLRVGVKGRSTRAALGVMVRRHAKADCGEDSEYSIALVTALLRTARLLARSDGDEAKRAQLIEVALRCANGLAAALP